MIKSIGEVPWSDADMVEQLEEFSALFEQRPIEENTYGMHASHMFLAWFVLKWLQPKAIVESGVLYGQGTWFFERACPNAKLYCIEPHPERIKWRSDNATYFLRDFADLNWDHLPKEETILFFDDHQNAFERVKLAQRWGLPRLMFEDNYPEKAGDCYSLKKVFTEGGCPYSGIEPNTEDARYLEQCLEIYRELPPVFDPAAIDSNREWHRPFTLGSLLDHVTEPWQQVFWDEGRHYYWMCYVELKGGGS